MNPAEHLSFHVYRIGCLFGDDKVVKAHDKLTVMYYLKANRTDTQWHFALHNNGPNGTIVCRATSGYIGPPTIYDLSPGPMLVEIISESRSIPIETLRGSPVGTRWFQGLDNRQYYWQCSRHLWRSGMTCLDTEGRIVATYRPTSLAISKDGELRIYPAFGQVHDRPARCHKSGNTDAEPLVTGIQGKLDFL